MTMTQNTFPNSEYRDEIVLRDQVLDQLRRVIDPDIHKDIVSLSFVKKLKIDYLNGMISFELELTTPACPVKDMFIEECDRYLKDLGWVRDVNITLTSQKNQRARSSTKFLSSVSHIVAVASCKGGVGKSTTAVNLAYSLSRMGAAVGIVDCDVYGPSLPSLIPIDFSQGIRGDASGALTPLEHQGVKLMSYGFIKDGDFAAIRGPLASGLVEQMISGTNWGSLDYLILDMPPGTGDIHLTIAQSVKVSATVLVTTPQALSVVDVIKGVKFFNELRIPTVAVVENMSYFMCGNCSIKHRPFSSASLSLKNELKHLLGILEHEEPFIEFPIDERMSCISLETANRFSDETGHAFPLVLAIEGDDTSQILLGQFMKLAGKVAREVAVLKFRSFKPEVSVSGNMFNLAIMKSENSPETHGWSFEAESGEEDNEITEDEKNRKQALAPREILEVLQVSCRSVRLACRCAECIDERTGQIRIVARKVPVNIKPKVIVEAGNFAVKVDWTDGHISYIGYTALEKLARETMQANQKTNNGGVGCTNDTALDW